VRSPGAKKERKREQTQREDSVTAAADQWLRMLVSDG